MLIGPLANLVSWELPGRWVYFYSHSIFVVYFLWTTPISVCSDYRGEKSGLCGSWETGLRTEPTLARVLPDSWNAGTVLINPCKVSE